MFKYALCIYVSIYQLILLADNQYIAHVSLLLIIFYFYSMENHYGLNGISFNLMFLENLLGKQTVWLTAHLDHLLKSVHVLLHAVMGAQVRHKIAGIHPIQPVEEWVDACMQVDEINLRDVSCQQRLITQLVTHPKILWAILFVIGCLIIFLDFCGRLKPSRGFQYMPQG